MMESFYLYWRNLKMQFSPFEGCEEVDYVVMLFHKTFVTETAAKIILYHVFSYHNNTTE